MAKLQELNPPSRVLTYLNENNNQRVVEFVIDQLEQEKISYWDSVIDLGTDETQEVSSPDLVNEKIYYVLTPSSSGDVELHLDTGVMSSGTCKLLGSKPYVPVLTASDFNYDDLMIFRNGVKQLKGEDVFFVSENVIRITQKLDADDWISVQKQVGV